VEGRAASRALGAFVALALAVVALGLFSVAPAAGAASSKATVTQYAMPRVPPTGGAGPLAVDQLGNVWFDQTYEVPPEEPGEPARFPGQIVRMNRQGEITVAARIRAEGLTVAPDGSVWFTGFHQIGRIAPDGGGTTFPLPDGENAEGKNIWVTGHLVIGADGNVWFSGGRGFRDESGALVSDEPIIGRLTPTGALAEFDLPRDSGFPIRLALGPDGNVWFTESQGPRIGRITPLGQIQHFPLPESSSPYGLAAGSDGAIWFKLARRNGAAIARITTTGEMTEFPLGFASQKDEEERGGNFGGGPVAAGPDGRIWFVSEDGYMTRIAPNGRFSRIALPTDTPQEMAVGPEGSVWYTSVAPPPCQPGDSVCGDGGHYQSGVIGRIDPAPLSVGIATVKLAAKSRQVKVRLTCIDGAVRQACKGRLRGTAGRAIQRRYRMGTDTSRAFTIRLSRRGQDKLQRTGRLRLRIIATLSGGRKATEFVRLRLSRR
jgi:virginiamycin B lyase